MENERRLNEDVQALHIGNMLYIAISSWPTKSKPAGDPTVFNVSWLLIVAPDTSGRRVVFCHRVPSRCEA